MGHTPDPALCLKAAEVQKINTQGVWCNRILYLTEEELGISLPDSAHLKDKAPLELVRLVSSRKSEDDADSPGTTDVLKAKGAREWERIEAAASDAKDFDMDAVFIVRMKAEDGVSDGRPYSFRARSQEEKEDWIREIKSAVHRGRQKRLAQASILQRIQRSARRVYASSPFQSLVAVLIIANFIANAAQSELQPDAGSSQERIFSYIDMAFTFIFLLELLINLTAHWLWPFWRDGWSVFDFVIVTVSLVSLKFDSVPGLSTLRLMRAFRVLRLFGRLSDLRQVRESERESKSEREREKERETCSLHY